jgi:superfamily II DNA or RNA helicase
MTLDWLALSLAQAARSHQIVEARFAHRKGPLYPHQRSALDELRSCWRGGLRWLLVTLPTGAGKTRIGAEVVRFELEAGRRVLWLAHRTDLVQQTKQALAPKLDDTIGVVCGGVKNPNPHGPLQIATVQALSRRKDLPPADLLVIDEAHHYVARDWEAIVRAYPNARRLMLSATPERADGVDLGRIAEQIIAPAQPRELVAREVLVPCAIVGPPRELSHQLAQAPYDAWLRWAEQRRTLVFCASIQHARDVAQEFLARGVAAASIDLDTPPHQRQELYAKLKNGTLRVLTNVYIATEGLDVPEIEVCMVARNVGHRSSWIQMTGRAVRSSVGKTSALIIDLCGLTHRFGPPGQDRQFGLQVPEEDDLGSRQTDEVNLTSGKTPVSAGSPATVLGEQLRVLHGEHLVAHLASPPAVAGRQPSRCAASDHVKRFAWQSHLNAAHSRQDIYGWMVVGALYEGFDPQGAIARAAQQFEHRTGARPRPAWRTQILGVLLGVYTEQRPAPLRGWSSRLSAHACFMDCDLYRSFCDANYEAKLREMLHT